MIDIREKLAGRGPAIAAGSAAALVLAALAWVLCTQPLAPAGAVGSGSAETPVTAVSVKEPGKGSAAKKGKADEGKKAAADKDDKTGKDEQKKDASPAAKEGKQPAAPGAAVKADSDEAGSQASAPPSGGSTSSKPAQKPSGSGGATKPAPAPAPQPEAQEPAPAPQPAPKPQHQHSWQAVYRDEPVYGEQWVPKIETVYTRHERWVCNPFTGGCGAEFSNATECGIHCADNNHGSMLDDSYTTKEEVDKGSYQTVQTGTTQVLDHYACSCGAVK